MPPIRTFHTMAGFYAVPAHEASHGTGHKSRLDRLEKFRDRGAYAFEELIAELGNMVLCAHLGLNDLGRKASETRGRGFRVKDTFLARFKPMMLSSFADARLIGDRWRASRVSIPTNWEFGEAHHANFDKDSFLYFIRVMYYSHNF